MTPKQHSSGASGPLKDIRVLDFGTFISGTFSAMLMGDMGADVIKVEMLLRSYPGRQHEVLNGSNREEVTYGLLWQNTKEIP